MRNLSFIGTINEEQRVQEPLLEETDKTVAARELLVVGEEFTDLMSSAMASSVSGF